MKPPAEALMHDASEKLSTELSDESLVLRKLFCDEVL